MMSLNVFDSTEVDTLKSAKTINGTRIAKRRVYAPPRFLMDSLELHFDTRQFAAGLRETLTSKVIVVATRSKVLPT